MLNKLHNSSEHPKQARMSFLKTLIICILYKVSAVCRMVNGITSTEHYDCSVILSCAHKDMSAESSA